MSELNGSPLLCSLPAPPTSGKVKLLGFFSVKLLFLAKDDDCL